MESADIENDDDISSSDNVEQTDSQISSHKTQVRVRESIYHHIDGNDHYTVCNSLPPLRRMMNWRCSVRNGVKS